jgi:hypothetical protein
MTGALGPGGARPAGRALVAVLIAMGGFLAACAGASPAGRAPEPLPTARSTASPAVQATLVQVDGALRATGLVLESALRAIRPAEPPSFKGVARWPFQAVLPDDPAGGYFVIYEFPDLALAADAGRDLAAYITSGPGRVQFPPDARFVIRQVGSTLVFFAWSPASSPDPKTPDVAAALASVGSEVPIPRG